MTDAAAVDRPSLTLAITVDMVDQFARLTGDVSALHADAAFARRSLYRERVAHGMLPLAALALIEGLGPGGVAVLERLTAAFRRPLYPGEQVQLSVRPAPDDAESRRALFYTFRNAVSGAVVTEGTVVLRVGDGGPRTVREGGSRDPASSSIVEETLDPASLGFAEIPDGARAGFDLHVRAEHRNALLALLRQGIAPAAEPAADLSAFVGASAMSTLVGVCLPGHSATFLECALDFDPRADWSEPCRLEGVVAFRSSSTRTIVEDVTISPRAGGAPLVRGRLKVRVNEPPTSMPSLSSLAERGLGLGLEDKVVLVTGGSRGLGETIAKLFALHGARVAVNYYRGRDDASRIVHEIQRHGGHAIALGADVADRDQVLGLVGEVARALGPVDVLVNNAVRDYTSTSFLDIAWEDVSRDLEVIVRGAFNCCQAVLPSMVERRAGKIINMGTVATESPPPGQTRYVLAKSALVGLTRSLAMEFAPHGIQVNMVCPSMVETDLTAGVPATAKHQLASATPMRRLPGPDEVANAVVLLASSLTSFTTGQQFMVTGGLAPLL
jgi:3-oxoacyl-[acyl-carrier protein] reductase